MTMAKQKYWNGTTWEVIGTDADKVELKDSSNLFSSNNVEGALKELFINVSNGKSLVGGAITDVDPNVVVPTNPTFQQLADAIGQISTGKKWASGTAVVSSNRIIDIVGLNFPPSMVIITRLNATYELSSYIVNLSRDKVFANYWGRIVGAECYQSNGAWTARKVYDEQVTWRNDGVSYNNITSSEYLWFAYE